MERKIVNSKKDVLTKAMDYLAMRDHSKSELQVKLTRAGYGSDEITKALDTAEQRGWLISPEELSLKVAHQLHRKRKSYFYINQYLRQKQLPPIEKDSDLEYKKAQAIAEIRFSSLSKASFEDKKQIARLLRNRGFDSETIARLFNDPC